MTANAPTQAISQVGPLRTVIKMNFDTSTTLAAPEADGQEYLIVDNLGLGNTISISALTAAGQQIYTFQNPGGFMRFTWFGGFYGVG